VQLHAPERERERGVRGLPDSQVYVHIYIQFTEQTHSHLYTYIQMHSRGYKVSSLFVVLDSENGKRGRHKCEHQWKVESEWDCFQFGPLYRV